MTRTAAAPAAATHDTSASRKPHVLIIGDARDGAALLERLADAHCVVSVAPADGDGGTGPRRSPDLVVVAVRSLPLRVPEAPVVGPAPAWVAWNATDSPDLAIAAYAAGAHCVLPAGVPGAVCARVVAATIEAGPGAARSTEVRGLRRRYARGDRLLLEADHVLTVESGAIAQRVVQHDGTEVLIGINGPSQTILGHPDDSCCLDLIAHEESVVTIHTWRDAASGDRLAVAMRARLRQLEAWSAVQARPQLTARIVGLLSLLANPFGRPHPLGVLIDVRLTHGQLAAATGSTRATITRALGVLRRRRTVWTVGRGTTQRFGLREREAHAHALQPLP